MTDQRSIEYQKLVEETIATEPELRGEQELSIMTEVHNRHREEVERIEQSWGNDMDDSDITGHEMAIVLNVKRMRV